MSRRPQHSGPPTREMVLNYLEKNPSHGAKRDIARGLDVATEHRPELRRILNQLEAEGALVRTAKRAFQPAEMPPPTGIVKFERIDKDGELIGRAVGRAAIDRDGYVFAVVAADHHRPASHALIHRGASLRPLSG